ncbi:MAG: hydroxymethylbilane synthase [Candidatus Acidulodesulfobacterium ferriphilum]|uniref:Porphobilinogen deaminase n=1 Tax=Candidatus Acidulodesulfobacterium ferriphilum TaxID=2597223 RepID=A0A519BDT9_9DELT|nr:MAG: hydroxymethylbilane synthase [Candidatus Acidulodesulfobacterium ferriphilum]
MKLKIGTRGSKLALYQANLVKDKIKQLFDDQNKKIDIEIKTIKTSGDRILTASLSNFGGKGLFVKEIEEALFSEDIDIAVHSLKDVPQVIPEELALGAVLKRDDPRDCVILKDKPESDKELDSVNFASLLKNHAIVGTSSLRRRALLARFRDDIIFEPLRGNIDTRLGKLRDGFFDAIVLSSSGLIRLNLSSNIDVYLDPLTFIPQCGQGAIVIEYKSARADIGEIIKPLNDEDTKFSVFAERACIKGLNCGCASPVGAYSYIEGNDVHIKGFVSNTYGEYLEDGVTGKKIDYENVGKKLALSLINKGGFEILSKNTIL